jgi:hypothetical protein
VFFLNQLSYLSNKHACPSPPSAQAAIKANCCPSSCNRRELCYVDQFFYIKNC